MPKRKYPFEEKSINSVQNNQPKKQDDYQKEKEAKLESVGHKPTESKSAGLFAEFRSICVVQTGITRKRYQILYDQIKNRGRNGILSESDLSCVKMSWIEEKFTANNAKILQRNASARLRLILSTFGMKSFVGGNLVHKVSSECNAKYDVAVCALPSKSHIGSELEKLGMHVNVR
jgi:hypothetical protein